ncbi:hypothetical protein D4R99_04895 [bacterium]|nr:MAG: hypothetical protein D4R99_04895 [bacterium]
MTLIEINDKQQNILDKNEFEDLVSERNKKNSEISTLTTAKRLCCSILIKRHMDIEIFSREVDICCIDFRLRVLRKQLGIETPTIHTEL